MFILFSKFSVITLIFPFLLIFLTEDCTHQKHKANNQARKANNKMNNAQIGLWGGEHISLDGTEQAARIEYDCGHGSIDQRIIPNGNGHFNVKGTHIREHGGPVRKDEVPDVHPAEFSGQINNNTMNLTVTESDTKELVGKFTLVYGQKPHIVKCR